MHAWYVGTPGMSSILRPLAESVRIHTNRRVHTLQRADKGWHLWFEDETSAGPFHAVAIAVPATRGAAAARPPRKPRRSDQPCPHVAMLVGHGPPRRSHHAGAGRVLRHVGNHPLGVAQQRQARPHQGAATTSSFMPRRASAARQRTPTPKQVAEELWAEVSHALSLPPTRPTQISAHLWQQRPRRHLARRNLPVLDRAHGRRLRRLVPRPPRPSTPSRAAPASARSSSTP